jgi:small-conductance mechanosensitive channel
MIMLLIGVVQVGLIGNALLSLYLDRLRQKQRSRDKAGLAAISIGGFIARTLLWGMFLLVGLDTLGVDITALVAGFGIGGIAVAMAAQNLLSDLFSSLAIVLDKPFVVGDFIVLGDVVGTVEHVGLKTTRIRALSGQEIVVSNTDLLSSRINNYRKLKERRVVFHLGVEYGTTAAQLKGIPDIIKKAVENQEKTRFDRAHFFKYGDFSLDFEVVYHVLDPDYNVYMDINQKIHLEIFEQFEQQGIAFAFPTQTVHMHHQNMPAGMTEEGATKAGT